MKIYIIREARSVEMYVVIPKWKDAFLATNRRKILGWGRSLPEAVARLGSVAEKLAVLHELSKNEREPKHHFASRKSDHNALSDIATPKSCTSKYQKI